MRDLCQNCGDDDHELKDCKGTLAACTYPHGGATIHHPHSILMCPWLHSFCHECHFNGHEANNHNVGLRFTPFELRQRFLSFSHLGLYTSLAFLSRDQRFRPSHWHSGLNSAPLGNNQRDLFLYEGPNSVVPENLQELRAPKLAVAASNLESKVYTYVALLQMHPRGVKTRQTFPE